MARDADNLVSLAATNTCHFFVNESGNTTVIDTYFIIRLERTVTLYEPRGVVPIF
jgi:hypothetical protein